MAIEGWYYLHENGDLIYKADYEGVAADIRDSNFAIGLWACDPTDRENAWTILVEALAGGANAQRIAGLAMSWGCDNIDALIFADHIGARLWIDGTSFIAARTDFQNVQESPCGLGDTGLAALAALAKELGYKPATMWGGSFKQLVSGVST